MTDLFKKALVVVAHPDDEVLGCGGTVAKLAAFGCNVVVAYMNDGSSSRPDREQVAAQSVKAVQMLVGAAPKTGWITVFEREGGELDFDRPGSHMTAAVAFPSFSGHSLVHVDFPSGRFERFPQKLFNNVVQQVVDSYKPDLVLTHDPSDLHKDHKIVSEAVMVACRFKPGSPVSAVLTFATISSSDINPMGMDFLPNLFVGIEPYLSLKSAAMSQYAMEQGAMPRNRGDEAIRTWANWYGLQSDLPAAEAFRMVRWAVK